MPSYKEQYWLFVRLILHMLLDAGTTADRPILQRLDVTPLTGTPNIIRRYTNAWIGPSEHYLRTHIYSSTFNVQADRCYVIVAWKSMPRKNKQMHRTDALALILQLGGSCMHTR